MPPSTASHPFSTWIFTFVVTFLAGTLAVAAQTPAENPSTSEQTDQKQEADQQEQIDELRRQVEILAEEIERLRAAEPAPVEITEREGRARGLAPSAAAVYRRTTEGVSFGGYGEMLLENFSSESESGAGNPPTTRLDFLRAILYAGYRFDDQFVFNSEIEIEHAGEISVEFAYLDYTITDNLAVRGGLLLLPLGLVNEFHEPTAFIGARRPETEQRILPSTWRENGGGLLGSFGRVDFRAYVLNGLDASGFGSSGLRGGRQKGMRARAANFAFAGRLDVDVVPGIFGGVGLYSGGSGQDAIAVDGTTLPIATTIGEFHGQVQLRGFDIRALYARAAVADAGPLSLALDLPADAPVAERMQGAYVQVGYNLLSQTRERLSVMPYLRLESVDTQARVPDGFARDLSKAGGFTTLGVELKPIPNIGVKVEYQRVTNEARTGRGQFNVNLGYAF
jgi:uncharacterized protein YlxW (UPF0749 family)